MHFSKQTNKQKESLSSSILLVICSIHKNLLILIKNYILIPQNQYELLNSIKGFKDKTYLLSLKKK